MQLKCFTRLVSECWVLYTNKQIGCVRWLRMLSATECSTWSFSKLVPGILLISSQWQRACYHVWWPLDSGSCKLGQRHSTKSTRAAPLMKGLVSEIVIFAHYVEAKDCGSTQNVLRGLVSRSNRSNLIKSVNLWTGDGRLKSTLSHTRVCRQHTILCYCIK